MIFTNGIPASFAVLADDRQALEVVGRVDTTRVELVMVVTEQIRLHDTHIITEVFGIADTRARAGELLTACISGKEN